MNILLNKFSNSNIGIKIGFAGSIIFVIDRIYFTSQPRYDYVSDRADKDKLKSFKFGIYTADDGTRYERAHPDCIFPLGRKLGDDELSD